ncbi:unnamed protein product [Cylindrotheca closterium]|uniref:O-fucosyltransferase family protein n=1 Tax=Cylindrotheca closterium TaxID=2856 RepID=A0AAD2CUS3_9STRA|nr:unnamed protein product [Cylindrotheca closterium]
MKLLGRNTSLRVFIQAVIIWVLFEQVRVFFRLDDPSSNTSSSGTPSTWLPEHNVLKLLDDYKKAHNVDTLNAAAAAAADASNNTRVYVVGQYSCPFQAGNRIFHFLNAFVHAVILDKPLVWKYCTTNRICPRHGKVEDCNQVLNRADWIPSYQAFVLGSANNPKTELLHGRGRHLKREDILNVSKREIALDQLRYPDATDVVLETRILERPFLGAWLTAPEIREKNILSLEAYARARMLFAAGSDFAYGALFHVAFQIDPSILPEDESLAKLKLEHPYSTSLAMHSRHQQKLDPGNDTSTEELCLKKAYQMTRKSSGFLHAPPPCAMVLMSDRSVTLDGLQQTRPSGCTPVLATHQKGQSFRSEHGEFAGAGFFQDLALAQHAKDAVVLTYRSSASELMRTVWRYQRFMTNQTGKIVACTIRDPNGTQCDCTSERIGPR